MNDSLPELERLRQIAFDRQPALAQHLGIRIISADQDEVIGEMPASDALSNRNGVLHGGAIMALADNIGGTAAQMNLAAGQATTTIESKTNFLRPIRIGDVARAVAVPLHKGRNTMIWQTTISRGDGKVAAIVTQTQMTLEWQNG